MAGSDILREKIKKLEFLSSASRMLNATRNLDQLLSVIMKTVKNALDVQQNSSSATDYTRKQNKSVKQMTPVHPG